MGKDIEFKCNAIDWLDLCLKEIILPLKFNTVHWFDSYLKEINFEKIKKNRCNTIDWFYLI